MVPQRISRRSPALKKPAPTYPTDRAGVLAVRMRIPEAKAVLAWLLERPAQVFMRDEIALALGFNNLRAERGVICLQRIRPAFASLQGPSGNRLPGGAGYIPADSPLRFAWANAPTGPVPGETPDQAWTRAGDAAFAKALADGVDRTEAGNIARAAAHAAKIAAAPEPPVAPEGEGDTDEPPEEEPASPSPSPSPEEPVTAPADDVPLGVVADPPPAPEAPRRRSLAEMTAEVSRGEPVAPPESPRKRRGGA